MTNTYFKIFTCMILTFGTYTLANGQVRLKDYQPDKDERSTITSNKGPDPQVLSKIPLIENFDMSSRAVNTASIIDPKTWKRIAKPDSLNSIQALQKRTSEALSGNRVFLLMKEKGETKTGSINRWQVSATKP